MASLTRSIKLPCTLLDATEIRSKRLGYPSLNAYFKALPRYDLLLQGSHPITLNWANAPLNEQEKIDQFLLRLTKEGKGQRGQFLSHLIAQLLTEDMPADAAPTALIAGVQKAVPTQS